MTDTMTLANALADVYSERMRQIEVEGWTAEHDDAHADGSMADAAACYAYAGSKETEGPLSWYRTVRLTMWPRSWSESWWKPKDRRRDLVRAGALIVAEIERLDRLEAKSKT